MSKLYGSDDTTWTVDPSFVMNSIVTCMTRYLGLKMPISHDLLILCCVYCIETENKKLGYNMCVELVDVITEGLKKDDMEVAARDHECMFHMMLFKNCRHLTLVTI